MQSFLQKLEPIWVPHPGQLEFLINPSKVKVLACGRRWGKTDVCAVQVLHALFRPWPTKHLILAPTMDQSSLLFDRAIQLLDEFQEHSQDRDFKIQCKRSPYPTLFFGKHRVTARSGHVPRALRGNEATHIVVDEAAYLPESLVTEVAMPMLATTDGFLTLISTPHGKNHFWKFFEMGQRGEGGVWSRRAPTSESPYVSDSFLANQKELISERAFDIEYGADFMDSAGQVFKTDAVQACVVSQLPEVSETISIGIDWARYTDFTAIAVVQGNQDSCSLIDLQRFNGQSWTETVRRVAEIVEKYPHARIVCDATGVGDPVIEQLQNSLPETKIEGLSFTASLKSELINTLAWVIEKHGLAMTPHPQLLRELEHFEALTTETGHVRLSARGGYHDDLVIALALAIYRLDRPYRTQITLGQPRTF